MNEGDTSEQWRRFCYFVRGSALLLRSGPPRPGSNFNGETVRNSALRARIASCTDRAGFITGPVIKFRAGPTRLELIREPPCGRDRVGFVPVRRNRSSGPGLLRLGPAILVKLE